jgi:hypothetical protein
MRLGLGLLEKLSSGRGLTRRPTVDNTAHGIGQPRSWPDRAGPLLSIRSYRG